jgi:hypothetical protein
MNDDFYDKCYDAWRAGRDPDLVSEDRYDMMLDKGFYPDEITWQDCYPNRGRPKQIQTYEPEPRDDGCPNDCSQCGEYCLYDN